MSRKIRVKSGTTSVELDANAIEIFDSVLKQAAPQTIGILEDTVEDIYRNAYNRWPVRQTKPLSERGKISAMAKRLEDKGYDRKRAYAAAVRMGADGEINISTQDSSKSKNSKGKLEYGFRVFGDTIEAFVGCRAPYAWAIKVGKNTNLPFALNARVSNELLWRPARIEADEIVRVTANELTEIVRKV